MSSPPCVGARLSPKIPVFAVAFHVGTVEKISDLFRTKRSEISLAISGIKKQHDTPCPIINTTPSRTILDGGIIRSMRYHTMRAAAPEVGGRRDGDLTSPPWSSSMVAPPNCTNGRKGMNSSRNYASRDQAINTTEYLATFPGEMKLLDFINILKTNYMLYRSRSILLPARTCRLRSRHNSQSTSTMIQTDCRGKRPALRNTQHLDPLWQLRQIPSPSRWT